MEVKTKTAEEFTDELVLRRNKINTVQAKVEGVETSVQDVKMVVEEIRSDIKRRDNDGTMVERSHTMMEGIGHELQLMRSSLQAISQNNSQSGSGLGEVKAEVNVIRKDVDYVKLEVGNLTAQIASMQIGEKENVAKIQQSTNTSPVTISGGNNQGKGVDCVLSICQEMVVKPNRRNR